MPHLPLFCRDRSKPALIFQDILNDGDDWLEIHCGAAHTVAVTRNGTVYSWGSGANGRLGHGNFTKASYKPQLVKSFIGKHKILKIACGSWHTAAIAKSGVLFTW